jgi:hypothetical protein
MLQATEKDSELSRVNCEIGIRLFQLKLCNASYHTLWQCAQIQDPYLLSRTSSSKRHLVARPKYNRSIEDSFALPIRHLSDLLELSACFSDASFMKSHWKHSPTSMEIVGIKFDTK